MEEQYLFQNRTEFREWLINNYNTVKGIWLTFSKNKSFPSIKAEEALEEVLCFGWIDGQIEALQGKEPALTNFIKMSPSVKKQFTMHYITAKTEETKLKRLDQIIARLNENKRLM